MTDRARRNRTRQTIVIVVRAHSSDHPKTGRREVSVEREGGVYAPLGDQNETHRIDR